MALRKQPDRRVKKKRKMEMPESLEISKRKCELEEPRNFDIVGSLLRNYGMTGENLVRDIFSYMDVSSLQGKVLVFSRAEGHKINSFGFVFFHLKISFILRRTFGL